MILSQQLSTVAARNLTRPAMNYLGKETSYADLKTKIARLSYLYQHDLGHGARVAFLTRNSPSVITTFFALTNIRSVIIPVDPERAPDEIVDWLKESKATHVAVTNDLLSRARDIFQSARLSLPLIEIEKKHGGEYDPSYTPPPDNTPVDTDPILLLRTASSTGKPKFVELNHKNLQHAVTCIRAPYHLTPADRVLTPMNWYHPYALIHGLLLPILNGATCVVEHGAENKEFLDFMLDARVTRLVSTPPLLLKLLITCKNEKRALPGLKSVTVGLGTLSPELRKAFGLLNVGVAHCYGLTESAWTLALEDYEDSAESNRFYVGKGLVGIKYKVLDPSGDEVPGRDQREGALAVMGPTIMKGYFEREKETKLALRGTWLYTGDYVRLDGDGETLRITFLGRKDDVLLEENRAVTADAIDLAVKGLAGVQDGAGFVLKNSKDQQVFACAVVKTQGSPLNEKQVIEHCASRLPSEQAPRIVVFTDVIPRDAGGGVNRSRLRNQFTGVTG